MGDCLTPPATVLGIFRNKPKVSAPPPKKFADLINAAYDELEAALEQKRAPVYTFGNLLADAHSAILRLLDIKEHELHKEKGREEYNRLAFERLSQMNRLVEDVSFLWGEIWEITRVGKAAESEASVKLHYTIMKRLLEQVGEIGAQYEDTP